VRSPGWPARLEHGSVVVRPFRVRDGAAWSEVRIRNEEWLARWEGRPPGSPDVAWSDRHKIPTYQSMLRAQRREAKAGRCLPFAVTLDRTFVGQVTVQNVIRGAFQSASIGYWVDEAVAGKGVMTAALSLVVDHCLGPVGLHRVEVNVRPENEPSLRLARRVGFREEAQHRRYLHIDGGWRDHVGFALTVEDLVELPGGLVGRLSG
jgi:ribosomal-protein-alanine N-acetyltransferase